MSFQYNGLVFIDLYLCLANFNEQSIDDFNEQNIYIRDNKSNQWSLVCYKTRVIL